jgi:hypothetical protein
VETTADPVSEFFRGLAERGREPLLILEGNTFVVSDKRGDIEASATDPTGLFSFDTRFLSKWVLTVNGQRLNSPVGDNLVVDPALPISVGWLELLDIPGRWGLIDAFGRGRIDTSWRYHGQRAGRHR